MDKNDLAELKKTRTEEQLKVIEYFSSAKSSWFSKVMTDSEYDALVQSKVANSKKRALQKFGLDEDEVKEINPAQYGGYNFPDIIYGKKRTYETSYEDDDDIMYVKIRPDETKVSSSYTKIWLFFSDAQIYMWELEFRLDKTWEREETQEFFYKDVTSLTTFTETSIIPKVIEAKGWFKNESIHEVKVNDTSFKLTVPGLQGRKGAGIDVPMENTEENNNRIHAMRQKIREKKS
jgi:hypothetical protein